MAAMPFSVVTNRTLTVRASGRLVQNGHLFQHNLCGKWVGITSYFGGKGKPLSRSEVIVEATMRSDSDLNPERAEAVLDYAVNEKGLIMETDDGYTAA